jgi:hypothetical protein
VDDALELGADIPEYAGNGLRALQRIDARSFPQSLRHDDRPTLVEI